MPNIALISNNILSDSGAAIGTANGIATLNSSGQIPSSQLPSYVDDVLEYANLAAFPATGETGKIYVTTDTNKTYRWTGSVYVEISASPGSTDAVTEGSTNLYYTDTRARAAHSLTTTGSSGAATYSSSTGVFNIPNYTLSGLGGEPTITAGTTAQYYRGDKSFQTLNTTAVAEGTNLYYTDARARAALSFVAGSGAYNSTTGVITIPTNTNQLTNGAGFITSYTETDTLATVTARGATTNTAVIINNNLAVNTSSPYNTSVYSLDINGGLLVKNTGRSASLTIINADPSAGGNNAFVVHTVGGTSGTSYVDIQGYYGTSITGSTTIRLNNAGGNVLVGSLSGTGTRIVTADSTGVLSSLSSIGNSYISDLAWSKITGAPSFLTSYTETSTLANVTARGASTSTQVTFSGAGDNTTTYSSIRFAGYNQGGGVGYHGVFEIQNTYGSVTNGKKFIRIDSSGSLQIINSAYTSNIFNLTDAGALTVGSIIKSGGTSSQILMADGSVVTAGTGITISGGTISASGSAGVSSFNTRTGAVTLSSSDVTTALGFTPYNSTNPSGYLTGITSSQVTTALGFTPYNATNPSGYITGITSSMVTTALGYTPYNSTNPSGYITSSANISGYSAALGGYGGNNIYTILSPSGNINGPVIKVRYDGGTANRYIDIGSIDGNGVYYEGLKIYNGGTLTMNGYTVLHSNNYNSYSPTLIGGGASGNWGINVTGTSNNITAYTINQNLGTGNTPTFYQSRFSSRISVGDGNGTPYLNTGSPGVWLSYNGGSDIFMGAQSSTIWGVYLGAWQFTVNSSGNISATGTISASNFSGSHSGTSSGTNTGDQTNISGTAYNITQYTINQNLGTGNSPTFAGLYLKNTSSIVQAPYQSDHDFPNGAYIQTDISVSASEPWTCEITAFNYGNGRPTKITINGYNYGPGTYYAGYAISTGLVITGMTVFQNALGYLCLYIPSQGYWNAYNVNWYVNYRTSSSNRVTSISNSTKPSGISYENAVNPTYSLDAANYNSYTPTLTGTGASGTWGINITGYAPYLYFGSSSSKAFMDNVWAGGSGYPGYQFTGGDSRFGFSSTSGVVNVYTDGNFYATDNGYLVLHTGNYSSYALPLSGGTVSGNITANTYNSNVGYSFVAQGYNNNGGFAMNNASTYWGLMWNYASNDWRLGYGSTTAQQGWNLRWDNGGTVWANASMRAPIFYDSDDTGYYVDPNAVSRLYRLQVIGDWAGASPNQGAINIRGQYPSMTFRNSVSGTMWLRHMDGSGNIQHYYASDGIDSANWSIKHTMYGNGDFYSAGNNTATYFYGSGSIRLGDMWGSTGGLYRPSGIMAFGTENEGWRFTMANDQKAYIGTDGNLWMKWAGDYISNLLGAKLTASSAPRATYSNLMYYAGFTLDANSMPSNSTGFTYSVNAPYTGPIAKFSEDGYPLQLNATYSGGGSIAYRTRNGDAGSWNSWYQFITTANIGSQTVASAGNATTVAGLAIHAGRNNEANKIVRTDANGYIQAGWINSDSGDMDFSNRITRIQCSNDNYIRYLGLTDFKVSLGMSGKNNYSRRIDYTSDANYHVGSFGHGGTDIGNPDRIFHYGSGFFDVWSGAGTYAPGTSHIHGFNVLHYTTGYGGNAYGWQMASQYNQTGLIYARWCSGGSFSAWQTIITSANIGSQSVSYASSAGSLSSMNISQFTNNSGYITSGSNVYGLYSNGFGSSNFTWYQSPGGLQQYGGSWASFMINNHGDGSSYYNQTIIMPFWGAPQYMRKEGGTNRGPWTFWSTENYDPSHYGGNFTADGYIRVNSNNNLYLDYNYGQSIVGVYSSYRYQGVFAMGDAYKLAIDGTTPGNLYGMAWSHPNAGGQAGYLDSHGLLVMVNGITYSAISNSIWARGDITAYSDSRVKTNVTVIENALEKVQAIRGVTFNRTDLDHDKARHAGVIAQEVLEVLPEVVTTNTDGMHSVAYGNLAALLIEAIKEQQIQIEDLKKQIEYLVENK
jgi:Chaperone of endosialidase